jgi:Bacteriocin-protection, YdeI or OmpD-Associated
MGRTAKDFRKIGIRRGSIAHRDWIHWITSAKEEETRARRIKNACSMLAAGKRRVCCFDRSGFYSNSLSAPKAAI